jgi:hypothetical protein
VNKRDPAGEPEGLVYHPEDIEQHSSAVLLAKDCADTLERHYPGWAWGVNVNPAQKMLDIVSFKLNASWGYRISMTAVNLDDPVVRTRVIIRAGGEILERHKLARRGFSIDRWREAPRDWTGMPRANVEDKSAEDRRRMLNEMFDRGHAQGQVKVVDQDGQRHILLKKGGEE